MLKRFLFLSLLFVSCVWGNKNVLVLHSYHQGLEWTDDITKGLNSVFDASDQKVTLYFEYLDSKRNISEYFFEKTHEYFLVKHTDKNYDLIIVSDNKALQFMNLYQKELFPNIPVVFCGVNNFNPSLIDNIDHVTGVKENADYQQTLELASHLFPKRQHFLVILDDTLTGQSILKEIHKVEESFSSRFEFSYYSNIGQQGLADFLNTHRDNLIVYLLAYNRDSTGRYFSYKEGIAQFRELLGKNIPMFGSWSFYLGKGIVGGAITSAKKQGGLAGKLALQVLQGVPIEQLSVVDNTESIVIEGDYTYIQKFGLSKGHFPQGAKIINLPQPVWITYRNEFIILGIILIIAVCVMLGILFLKMEENRLLEESNRELDDKVKRATERILENERLFRFLSETSNSAIILLDLHYRLTYANQTFETYFKQEAQDLISEPIEGWLCERLVKQLMPKLSQISTGALHECQFEYHDAKLKKDYRICALPRFSEDDKLLGYKIMIDDISHESLLVLQAHKDSLTGLYNRTHFDQIFKECFAAQEHLVLMMMDIDYFKNINDTYGHATGDIVLQNIAELITKSIRSDDKAYRIGGEEFAILLSIPLEKALAIAENIRSLINKTATCIGTDELYVTISIGVAIKNSNDLVRERLFERADKALYQAKAKGRNRTEVATIQH